jgi:hypothetical protein
MLRDMWLRDDKLIRQRKGCAHTHRQCTAPSLTSDKRPIDGEGMNTFPSFFASFSNGDYYFITPVQAAVPRSVAGEACIRSQNPVAAQRQCSNLLPFFVIIEEAVTLGA